MKYFTKEYIKECDCYEIQILKRGKLKKFDFYIERDTKSQMIKNMTVDEWSMLNILWLPTGDQLDEEIVRIIGEGNLYEILIDDKDGIEVNIIVCDLNKKDIYGKHYKNHYLAKILLLKRLIKESK